MSDREAFAEFLMGKSAPGKSDELEAARQETVVEQMKKRGNETFRCQLPRRAENDEDCRFKRIDSFVFNQRRGVND